MIYKEYGKTGKKVSAIGFGGMRFTPAQYESGDYTDACDVVRYAHDRGINYFDTAPGYCDQKSEEIFGEAFVGIDRSSFYLSSKCGLWNATTADGMRGMLEQSLTRMKTDYIDFYHMWNVRTMDDYHAFLKKGGVYEGAVRAKEEGLIRHICFSTHMSGDEIAAVANDGLFEGATLGYNAVNFSYRQKGAEALHRAGLGTVTMNPLGGGVIPQNPDYFAFLKEHEGDNVCAAALRFIIAQDTFTVALSGMHSRAEVDDNVMATEHLTTPSEAIFARIREHQSRDLNALCTGCGYCDECPQGLPIPRLMDIYNQRILFQNDPTQVLNRFNIHWAIDTGLPAKCIGCGICEGLCTQKLPIIERMAALTGMVEAQAAKA